MDSLLFFFWNLHTVFESLPISSSAHMTLLFRLLKKDPHTKKSIAIYTRPDVQESMHLTTALVLILTLALFTPSLVASISQSPFHLFLAVGIADFITGITYVFMRYVYPLTLPLPLGIFISALLVLSLTLCPLGTAHSITPMHALLIGLAQACALLPGISRLAATIVTASWLGIDPLVSALFSLAIELPLILASLAKAAVSDRTVITETLKPTPSQATVLTITCITSTVILVGVVMMHMHHMLSLFGYYLLGLALFLMVR